MATAKAMRMVATRIVKKKRLSFDSLFGIEADCSKSIFCEFLWYDTEAFPVVLKSFLAFHGGCKKESHTMVVSKKGNTMR